jgi:hypothetical protein
MTTAAVLIHRVFHFAAGIGAAIAGSTALRQCLAFAGEQQPGGAVDVVAAAARPAGGIARPARRKPPAPVSPVLSGRDQASASPSIANPHPLTGAGAQEDIIRIWQIA